MSPSAKSFPFGTKTADIFKQYFTDAEVRLLDMGRVVRYENDEPSIARLAGEFRAHAERCVKADPHESAAWLGCAALFTVMRLWCRPQAPREIEFCPRDIQRRVWCTQLHYGLRPNLAYQQVWPAYHTIAEAADKARPSSIRLIQPDSDLADIQSVLKQHYTRQIDSLMQQASLLTDAVNTLRDSQTRKS